MKTLVVLLFSLSMCVLAGCSNGGDTEELTASELAAKGWEAYAAKDYPTALARFNESVSKDASYADAYNGLGWTASQLNDLPAAVTHFSAGIARSATLLDLRAGIAFVYNAQKNYLSSAQRGLEVIQTNPTWVFMRDRSVSASDVRLLLAADYFAVADYANALQQVQILSPGFSADVATVAGQRALAEEIERLRSVV
jgi:tetratricopeptide (TPR) repeat protein